MENEKTNQLSEKHLMIIWPSVEGHKEVKGISVFGYFPARLNAVMPNSPCSTGIEIKQYYEYFDYEIEELGQTSWGIVEWLVHPRPWPTEDDWLCLLEHLLQSIFHHGAIVAWAGLQDGFAFLPDLFDPQADPLDCVYAYFIPERGFWCSTKIGYPFQIFSSQKLYRLQNSVQKFMIN